VIYNLRKIMGSGLDWMDEDRVPLCTAYLPVSADPVTETGRSKERLWGAVQDTWTAKIKKRPFRDNSNVSALETQFKKIVQVVSALTLHYLADQNVQPTGNLSDEDIISCAVARYCSLDICEAH